MATKDWKSIGKNKWQRKDGKAILKIDYNNLAEHYFIFYGSEEMGYRIEKSEIKTLSQAIAFAKAYMRTQ